MNNKVINKFWAPIKDITESVETFCKKNNYKNILEIGPGFIPFSLATKSVGFNEKITDYIELDIDINPLPFEDKSIDFVYSRHTLEDIQNPDFAMKEIIRISNSGYIETPSPLIEITKGVDGVPESYKYSGYIHHRYIIWSDIQKNEIYFLPKYSNIIDNFLEIDQVNLDKSLNLINTVPAYWNNYFIWSNSQPKIIMYKNGINFGLNRNMIEDYNKLINEAVNVSIQNTDYFLHNYKSFLDK
jgi:hypothetical protein